MKKGLSVTAYCLILLILIGCATTSSFTVLTYPAGADIYVDGEPAGKTPTTIKVKFTENEQMVTDKKILMVKLPGYKVQKEVISPEGASHKTLDFTLVAEANNKTVSGISSKSTTSNISSKATTTSKQEAKAVVKDVVSKPSQTGGVK